MVRRRRHGVQRRSPTAYVVLIALALFAILPLLLLVFNSLKPGYELGNNPLGPPEHPVFSNFLRSWELGNYAATMRNSLLVASGTAVGMCVISGCAAYALSRSGLRFESHAVLYMFIGTTIPPQLFVIPLFYLWTKVNLTDKLFGLVIIYWGLFSPFTTLLLRSYFLALPRELEEAARVDGANELQVLTRIVAPLAWPGFLVVALVSVLLAWNEFFFAVTFIQQSENLKPVATSFLAFQSRFGRDWGLTSAGAVIMILPVIVFFLLLQRRFIAGLTSGALKG